MENSEDEDYNENLEKNNIMDENSEDEDYNENLETNNIMDENYDDENEEFEDEDGAN